MHVCDVCVCFIEEFVCIWFDSCDVMHACDMNR